LSQILETGPIPPKYFLSGKACAGILRRAERRGKELPIQLRQALQVVARESSMGATPAGKIRLLPCASTPKAGGGRIDAESETFIVGLELGNQGTGGNVGWHYANKPFRTLDTNSVPGIAHALRADGFDASEDGTGRGTPLVPVLNEREDLGYFQCDCGDSTDLEARADGTANALLTPNGGRGGIGVGAVAYSIQAGATRENPESGPDGVGVQADVAYTIEARQKVQAVAHMAVRRLTPVECERLQGFPDNYTNIPGAADGPRYKALGNSMARPVMFWIGRRIKEAYAHHNPRPR
jgi:DNA (cytosine-5)-methyltransferase 1